MSNNSTQIRFTNPNRQFYARNIMYASALGYPMTEKNRHKGATAVLIGSGPSLKDDPAVEQALRELYGRDDTVFYGLKVAIRWLTDHGMAPQYGVSIDPGAHIACAEKIPRVPGVTHIMATVTAPEVFDYLEREQVELFNSVCGLEQELDLYEVLLQDKSLALGGYNVINRALGVAQHHGCERFVFAGADSGWREDQDWYCDGTRSMMQKKVYMNDDGRVDGTLWCSTPDMVASAVALARFAKNHDEKGEGYKVRFIGDVLPEKLRHKDEEFLQEVAS